MTAGAGVTGDTSMWYVCVAPLDFTISFVNHPQVCRMVSVIYPRGGGARVWDC